MRTAKTLIIVLPAINNNLGAEVNTFAPLFLVLFNFYPFFYYLSFSLSIFAAFVAVQTACSYFCC
uniref:Uncharacterized protein n=1 Tax=Microviridae sp. ctMjH1 TaxID=2824994 RepID=A0A8S5UPV7_9VIRU|nr:MAG TPA: hypothetical protein [Microviridae sp. ctMjH1]